MLKAIAIPLILHTVLLQRLQFRYKSEIFGNQCESRCIRSVNRWARVKVPATINVEVAILVGTACKWLCESPRERSKDVVTTRELVWDGFVDVKKMTLIKPYVCTFTKNKRTGAQTGICGITSDVHRIKRKWKTEC